MAFSPAYSINYNVTGGGVVIVAFNHLARRGPSPTASTGGSAAESRGVPKGKAVRYRANPTPRAKILQYVVQKGGKPVL